jgi:hypothetical protein
MVMKSLTALLATTILLAGIGASDAAVRIVEDAGGRIETYVDKYKGVLSSGEMVIIDGFCASACTIVLGTVPHDKICVTSRAKLGFHAAWDPGSNGRRITNPEATQSLYSMYPFEVRHWIDQRGGLTRRMIFLSGRQLAAMYRPCYLDSQASLKKRPRRLNESRRCQSVVISETLSDLINPSVKRVKSGMKALVVKMKYIANHENAKKPVVTL